MPRTCAVCSGDDRDAIERAVVLRKPYRDIEKLYGVSRSSISRHVNHHMLPYLSRLREEEGLDRAASLVARLDELTTETREILRAAREEGGPADDRALRAIKRLERQLELEAQVLKVIETAPRINVTIAPEVHQVIVDAWGPTRKLASP